MSSIRTLIDQVIAVDFDGDLSPRIDAWFHADKEATAALDLVLDERKRQNEKWGEQNHNDEIWLAILTEEVGELAQAILHNRFGGRAKGMTREELTHVAAVAVQWLECMDRLNP